MNLASRSTIFFALGPGRAVMSRGVFVSVAVIMKSSKLSANLLIGQRLLWCRGRRADFFRVRADYSPAHSANWRFINRRRRGWVELRRVRRRCVGDGGLSFAFPADAAVPRIFNDYTTISKLFADAIAGGEVSAGASSVALGDEFFHVFVAQSAFCGGNAKRFQLRGIVILNLRKELDELGQ